MAEYNKVTMGKRKKRNLLLFGQAGVGKSTFINALYNYISYQSLDEAKQSKAVVAVPYNLTVIDENMKKTQIQLRSNSNEIMASEGQSSTRKCKVHCLGLENCTLRIIDSPGIGDTQAIEQDMTNFRNMCTFISELGQLHAICIFLKPNESRLSETFQYFMKEVISQLQMRYSARIAFVFTNSRNTFELPGATIEPLTALLDQIKNSPPNPQIPLNKNNAFYLDSEDFRFLVALQNNIPFDPLYYQMCQLSWNRSRQECTRLINYVVGDQHTESLSLSNSNADRQVTSSTQPLSRVFQDNLRHTPELHEPNKQVINWKEMTSSNYSLKKENADWRQTGNLSTNASINVNNHLVTGFQEHTQMSTYSNVSKEYQTNYQTVTPMDTTQPTPIVREPHSFKSSFQSAQFNSQNFNANPRKEYNVLLLGTTGVGKSTFINAFANYLSFKSLDEAVNNNPIAYIPTQFSIPDENYEQKHINFGSHPNEDMANDGQSATQSCKAYEFPLDGFVLRIIDTPGIGDTRGIERDRQNVHGVLNFLSDYDDLYAICILLKPNEPRLTPLFSFCIKQLLSRLHASASNNIIFIFTNSRTTFYRPGDTATPLKALLDKIRSTPPYPKIPYGKDNIYCLDNEAFRFLVAFKYGIRFSDGDRVQFGHSWTKSVEEINRMIRYIVEGSDGQGLTPHNIQETMSINHARDTIVEMAKPLSDLTMYIQSNLQVLYEHKMEIENCDSDVNKLKSLLYMPVVRYEITDIGQPRTVCAGENCREQQMVGNELKYHYPRICHNPCKLNEVPKEIVGPEALKHCEAINHETDNCFHCGCHYSKHLHVCYESNLVKETKVDPNIEKQLQSVAGTKQAGEDLVRNLEAEIKTYEFEDGILTESTAKLAVFLKQNGMIVCSDPFKDYLTELIDEEESLSKSGARNSEIIQGLKKKLNDYEHQKDILRIPLQNSNTEQRVTMEDVRNIIAMISNMKYSGIIFKKSVEAQNKAKRGQS